MYIKSDYDFKIFFAIYSDNGDWELGPIPTIKIFYMQYFYK